MAFIQRFVREQKGTCVEKPKAKIPFSKKNTYDAYIHRHTHT